MGREKTGKRAVGLFMIIRGGLPGMFGSCKADLTKRRIRPRPRARATSISLSREHRNAGRIALSPTGRRSISYEYCCPRRYMTSSAAWCSPKICTEARTLDVPLPSPFHAAIFIPRCHVNQLLLAKKFRDEQCSSVINIHQKCSRMLDNVKNVRSIGFDDCLSDFYLFLVFLSRNIMCKQMYHFRGSIF